MGVLLSRSQATHGHMPRGSENAHGRSRSTLRWMAWSVVLLVTGVVTTPIFQAGHEGQTLSTPCPSQ